MSTSLFTNWTIGQWIGWIVAYTVTLLLSIPCFARIFPCTYDSHMYLIWANMYTLYIYLPAYLILVTSIVLDHLPLIIWCGMICFCHIIWILPDFLFCNCRKYSSTHKEHITQSTTRITIFSSNLLMVNHDTTGICQEILHIDPDILMCQEYSQIWDDAFQNHGIIQKYKFNTKHVRNDSFGTAIFSKYRIIHSAAKPSLFWIDDIPFTRALIAIDNKRLQIYNLHPLPPRLNEYMNVFNHQLSVIYDMIKSENDQGDYGLLVAGDFNNTQHNYWAKTFASIENMESAHSLCGRGYAVTFPNGIFPVPPIRLDHCFVNTMVNVHNIQEGEGYGSDHRPLVIEINI
eukprot:416010_1